MWSIQDSRKLYNIPGWSQGYFDINEKGELCAFPGGAARRQTGENFDGKWASLPEIMRRLTGSGEIRAPCVLRFPQIFVSRIRELGECFSNASEEFGFVGGHRIVYPLKVNQHRHVVEEIIGINEQREKDSFPVGLEVGSKPELLAALVMTAGQRERITIICNGYKDRTYVGAALAAGASPGDTGVPADSCNGLQAEVPDVIVVVDALDEIHLIMEIARELDITPAIGLRVKLASRGSGTWEKSGGQGAKFGLTPAELLRCLDLMKAGGFEDSLVMLHFHIGSQVTRVRRIQRAVHEAARVYTRVRKKGFPVRYLNIGGGLGVDYEGSFTTRDSSANYSMQEYANHVVYTLADICSAEDVPNPVIVTESGRTLAAFHALTAVELTGMTPHLPLPDEFSVDPDDPKILREMFITWRDVGPGNYREYLHDIMFFKERLDMHFMEGELSLEERARGDQLFRAACHRIAAIVREENEQGGHLRTLEDAISRKYLANFSAFQSVPDAWAINQLFPVMPLQQLRERPGMNASIADMTCDSDGMIKEYISPDEAKKDTLEIHPLDKVQRPYYLGVFLTGAYQEVMGDYHNLFGRTYRVSIEVTGPDEWEIRSVEKGETCRDILGFLDYGEVEIDRAIEELLESVESEGIQEGKGNDGRQEGEGSEGRQEGKGNDGRQEREGREGKQEGKGTDGRQEGKEGVGRQEGKESEGRQEGEEREGREEGKAAAAAGNAHAGNAHDTAPVRARAQRLREIFENLKCDYSYLTHRPS